MNKFKVGDIVLATASNDQFVSGERGKLFIVVGLKDWADCPIIIIDNLYGNHRYMDDFCNYYEYKFRKANKKQIKKFKFDYIVNKLKGGHTIDLEKII